MPTDNVAPDVGIVVEMQDVDDVFPPAQDGTRDVTFFSDCVRDP